MSNQEPRRARFLQERLAPLLPLSGTAFSGDLGHVKQELAFYEQAERRLDIIGLGQTVVLLDDTQDNIETATRHGWTGIHYRRDLDWHGAVTDALDVVRGGAAAP